MRPLPASVSAFLAGGRVVVAGVSRDSAQPANAVFRKLRSAGYDVVPVNPRADTVEGVRSFAALADVTGDVHGVVVVTPPAAAEAVVRACVDRGISHVWLHRSFGAGSVSSRAVERANAAGMTCVIGGCPLMFVDPVDVGHRCMRWWLGRRGRLPT